MSNLNRNLSDGVIIPCSFRLTGKVACIYFQHGIHYFETRKKTKTMKSIISIIILFIAIAITNTVIAQTGADTLKTATIKVSGITCNGDMPVIRKKLLNQEGIDEAAFSAAKSGAVTFTVKYHSAIITEKKIREVIEGAPSCDNPNLYPYKVKTFKADTTPKL